MPEITDQYDRLQDPNHPIHRLAAAIQGYYQRKRQDEIRKQLKDYLFPQTTTTAPVMGDAATIPLGPRQTNPIQQPTTVKLPRYQGLETRTTTGQRDLTPQSAFELADILEADPTQALSMALKLKEQEKPQFKGLSAGETPGTVEKGVWRPTGPQNETPAQRAIRILNEKKVDTYGQPSPYQAWQMGPKFNADEQDRKGRREYEAKRMKMQEEHNRAMQENKRIAGDIFEFDDQGNVSGISAQATPAQLNAARRNVNDNLTKERKAERELKRDREFYLANPEKYRDIISSIDQDLATKANNIAIYQNQFQALNTRKLQHPLQAPDLRSKAKQILRENGKDTSDAAVDTFLKNNPGFK